ncbi:MAG: 3'(2'),5'-bisphosphate nucleotidase CysQ [Halioglobus sp.]|nr:3'(2'),5'-bisphosphate nucleotidase CysQ [Halioglobus sp.]
MEQQDLQQWVSPLLDLCLQAGQAICAHYHAPASADYQSKQDDSPLTLADLASHAILQAGLTSLDATVPVLSEESVPADIAHRRQWRRYWLIDPLDGTKEFLARTGQFTINIALIDDHRPALGLLYLPLEQIAYVGIPGQRAATYSVTEDGGWSVCELVPPLLRPDQPLVVLASRRHGGERLQTCLEWVEKNWPCVARSNMGSALKFCCMARGQGDFYPRFAPCCEWDTAAGQALLEAVGGCLVGLNGEPLRYNCGDSLYSPPFYGMADGAHPLWERLLQVGLD